MHLLLGGGSSSSHFLDFSNSQNLLGLCYNLLFALLATSLIASANYVINEWLDREFDQFHPIKKNRPAVSQGLKAPIVWALWIVLSVVGLLGSYILLPFTCFVTLLVLWIMGILYNVRPFRTKDVPYLDVLSESLNNALRLLIGYFAISATTLPPISIILGYWMAGAYLMAIKRYSEYRQIGDPGKAGLYRKSFKFYSERRLLDSSLFYAMFSVFLIGAFLIKYHIEYIFAMPFICLLYVVYFNLSFQDDSTATKPEKLLSEKKLMAVVILVIAVLAVLSFVHFPFLSQFQEPQILEVK